MNAATNNVIERYSRGITDPVSRLRFQRACLKREQAEGDPPQGLLRRRARSLGIIAATEPFSRERLAPYDRALLSLSERASSLGARLPHSRTLRIGSALALTVAVLAVVGVGISREGPRDPAGSEGSSPFTAAAFPDVWLVESGEGSELYSNGLTISNEFLTHTGPRSYPIFDPENARWETARWDSAPAGLIFHTTESDLAEFDAANNEQILRNGRGLAEFVRREQLYNFLIDRFGRVHRIVPENEYAFHAGHSVWSDERGVYLGLNPSFIGIALETIRSAGSDTPAEKGVTPAQLRGARLLTEWLRGAFRISARNSVAHEMVSVNPDNMLIGYHTDWGGQFPFDTVGLPDNYREKIPSIALWGFRYDASFLNRIGGRPWPGIASAEQAFQERAAGHGGKAYRTQLRARYHELLEHLRTETPVKSWSEASL